MDSSLQELTRLVKTLGYNVVGRVTQKRSSDRYAAVLGGQTRRTGAVDRWVRENRIGETVGQRARRRRRTRRDDSDVEKVKSDDDESDDTHRGCLSPREQAQIVIVDCDLSPPKMKTLNVPPACRAGSYQVIIEIFSRHARTSERPGLQGGDRAAQVSRPRLRETGGAASGKAGASEAKGPGKRVWSSISAEFAIA